MGDKKTLVSFMHKFEEFVDHSLEKFPMRFQESRILTDNIHDVAGNYSLVVLATDHLSQS